MPAFKVISHKKLVDSFYESWSIDPVLFDIVVPYRTSSISEKSRKRKRKANSTLVPEPGAGDPKQPSDIQLKFDEFIKSEWIDDLPENDTKTDNKEALNFMDTVHNLPYLTSPFNGENINGHSIECQLNGETYLIPRNCRFFNKNILQMRNVLPLNNQFDFIVMDPPWWNKYIRRVNAVKQENGYKMLDNEDIKSLPIEELLSPKGIVVIWCTNSPSHREAIETEMLPNWRLKLVTMWHWMKVTRRGRPICDFHGGTGKQPYELIFIAAREDIDISYLDDLPRDQMLVSVPSVIHSHKFPIFHVLKPFLQRDNEKPWKCLEIFARYLQPHFTSVGLEVLKLQNKKIFTEKVTRKEEDQSTSVD